MNMGIIGVGVGYEDDFVIMGLVEVEGFVWFGINDLDDWGVFGVFEYGIEISFLYIENFVVYWK